MELTKEEQELFKLFLKAQIQQQALKAKPKPFHIKALQFSAVFLSLVLFITVTSLGVLLVSKPDSASAANTYTETWTASTGMYSTSTGTGAGEQLQYHTGVPADGTVVGSTSSVTGFGDVSGMVTILGWTVTGTVN